MRLAVLLSGRGSNFQAIHDAIEGKRLDAAIVCVISNRPDARGIEKAREYGYDAHVIDHKTFGDRAAHEEEVLRVLDAARPDYIALAGYMRLLSAPFIERHRHRILNIHPSLLPSFPGLDVQKKALDWGVKIAGCTVHFVTEGVDEGPIIIQAAVPVMEGDTAETLSVRILAQEHRIYPRAIQLYAEGRLKVEGRHVVVAGTSDKAPNALLNPA